MPEGHVLHRLAATLRTALAGAPVSVSSPQGRFAESAALLDGSVLEGAEAYGKHLFLHFAAERVVHVHLGLYGGFAVDRAEPVPEPVGQVRLRLVGPARSGLATAYADLRGATACDLVTPEQVAAVTARLGPDPLREDADPDRAWERISRSRAPVARLLMDQSVLAGIGNVYRAEVLFRHRLDPHREGRTLRRATWTALWADLVDLMGDGVRRGHIHTVRAEHQDDPGVVSARGGAWTGRPADRRGGDVYVYRRQGEPCLVCGSKVRTEALAGRNLFWCPRCQRATRSRALQ